MHNNILTLKMYSSQTAFLSFSKMFRTTFFQITLERLFLNRVFRDTWNIPQKMKFSIKDFSSKYDQFGRIYWRNT